MSFRGLHLYGRKSTRLGKKLLSRIRALLGKVRVDQLDRDHFIVKRTKNRAATKSSAATTHNAGTGLVPDSAGVSQRVAARNPARLLSSRAEIPQIHSLNALTPRHRSVRSLSQTADSAGNHSLTRPTTPARFACPCRAGIRRPATTAQTASDSVPFRRS